MALPLFKLIGLLGLAAIAFAVYQGFQVPPRDHVGELLLGGCLTAIVGFGTIWIVGKR